MRTVVDIGKQVRYLSVARDFSRVPGPRYEWQGKNSGEEFLTTHLRPQFLDAESAGDRLIVDLDDTEGYSSAFLDGSFGVLAREIGSERVLRTIEFITNDEPFLEEEITIYMKQTEE